MASVPMTVAELREKLAQMPDDAFVIYLAGGSDEWRGVGDWTPIAGKLATCILDGRYRKATITSSR